MSVRPGDEHGCTQRTLIFCCRSIREVGKDSSVLLLRLAMTCRETSSNMEMHLEKECSTSGFGCLSSEVDDSSAARIVSRHLVRL